MRDYVRQVIESDNMVELIVVAHAICRWRYRAKFNDQLNLMTLIWRRGGGRQGVYWACVGAMTARGGVIRGRVRCLNLYE